MMGSRLKCCYGSPGEKADQYSPDLLYDRTNRRPFKVGDLLKGRHMDCDK